MSTNKRITRRGFVRGAAAATVAVPWLVPGRALGADGGTPANERIVMGAIGVGGRGTGDMRGLMGFSEVQMIAVCDPVPDHCKRAKDHCDQRYGNTDCSMHSDFRDIVTRDDVDAVMIGTPDHWHAIITIEACRNGKDVFCERTP